MAITLDDQYVSQITKLFVIPPRPELLTELYALMQQEEPSLVEMGNIIAKDISISAAVLKLINSPIFGIARTVSNINQAVMFLGFDRIYGLVQGIKLKQSFAGKSSISLERFWDTSEEIAQVALFVGSQIKTKVPVESLYTLGLFHDAGVPLMAMKFQNYIHVLVESNKNYDHSLVELEEKYFQTNHAIVGYFLASGWNLPKELCTLILRHHDLTFLDEKKSSIEQMTFSILKMAENIVHTERRYVAAPDWVYLKEAVLDVLGITNYEYNDIKEDAIELVIGN